MSTAIELDLLLDRDQLRDIVGLKGLCLRGQRLVQGVDVCLVVFLVVKLHDLLGDHWLQSLCVKAKLAHVFFLGYNIYHPWPHGGKTETELPVIQRKKTHIVRIRERRKSVGRGGHLERVLFGSVSGTASKRCSAV